MTAELVLRTRCEHGRSVGLGHCPNDGLSGHDHGGAVECDQWCPGGSEVVLDPEQEIDGYYRMSVADIIDALEGS